MSEPHQLPGWDILPGPGLFTTRTITGTRPHAPGIEREPPQRGARRAADEDGCSPSVLLRSLKELNEVQVCETWLHPASKHTACWRPSFSTPGAGAGWGVTVTPRSPQTPESAPTEWLPGRLAGTRVKASGGRGGPGPGPIRTCHLRVS